MDANDAGSVSSNVGTQSPQNGVSSSRNVMGLFKLIFAHKAIAIIAVVLLIIIGAAIFAGQKLYQANKDASPVASRFDDQKIPLGSAAGPGALQLNTSQALSINGQLRANNTLVLSPSTQPSRGTAGQLYYDSTANQLLYHNGQSFVAVADTTRVDQLQTQLQGTASQEEVASIAQQLQAIQSELGQIQVPDNIAQLDGVNNFSAHNTFAAGLTAANLSVSGATALGSTTASSLILSNPLGVTSGGTGLSSLPLNGVLIGQGTNPVAVATASGAGQCLVSTAGAPTFQPCPGGGGGVNSLNGLSGALTLANASAAGSTIVINDATTASKGIASFNAANFTVSGGAVNTIQNISTTAAPLFNGLTVTNNLTAGTLTGDGTNVTNVNAAQLGGQVATFYLNASNISSGTLNDARLSANIAQYNAPTANFTGNLQQGGNSVCTTAGNCVGTGGAVGGSGTAGTIAVWTGSGFTLTDSLLSQSGGTITANGDLTVSGDVTATNLQGNGAGVTNVNAAQLNGQTAAYYLNATNISAGTLADARLSSNVTLQGNVFNGAGQLVQLNASSQLPSVSGALLTSLNASNISSGTLSDARLSSNVALLSNAVNFTGGALQFNGSDVCTTAGNCAGVGGGVTTSGGTPGTLAVFDGAGFSIVDSLVSQSGTTVTISGDLVATSLAGDGTAITNVNAAQLNGQGAAYYLNATNINAGTLSDARLSSNVTLQGNTFNGANQLVQLDATGALPALDGSNLLNVNAALLGGQNGAYYLDLANATGTLNDARLSNNVALFDAATANFTGNLQQGGNDVCTTAGNCIGSGAVGGSGTPGTIAVWDGSGFTLTDSLLSQSGTTVTVSGDLVADNLQGNGAGVTNVNAVQLNGQTAAYYLNASNVNAGTLADARLSANVTLQGNVFNGAGQLVQLNASSQLPAVSGALLTDLDADQISAGTLSDARLSSNVALYNAPTANFTGTLQQGGNNVCTTAGNCAGVGGGVTTPGGTAGQLAVFSGAQTIVDSIISDDGSTVTIGGTLAVNTITPTAAMTIGSTSQALTLQGNGSTQLSVTAAGTTNSLSFATPSGTNKSVVIPNASGTVVVSASGPLSIDANGNISCATCTTSGGGSGGAVDSLNGLNGALNIANASGSGSTITIDDASTVNKGIASFNSSNFTVSAGAVNTVQNISVTAAPSFAGLTLSGNLSIGTNSIVTGGATIGSTELDVLDGGIDETEVTGVITDVTAGNGLTGGGASGNATLNVVSANGGIVVTPDNIALTLQPSGDGLSTTTSSGSGLEILAGGITLLQGCSDGQVLKWNETSDTWGCAADAGGTGVGDDILVNGSNANGANFLDTASSGTATGVTWALNTTPSPNEVSISIANASATQAGSVTTGVQTFAGDKTFNNAVTITGLFTANGNITLETGDTITVNGDAVSDFTGTGLTVTGGALQTTLGTSIDSSEIVDGTIVGTDIAAATIANSNLVNSSLTVTAGNGLTNGGSVSLGGSTTLNIASANGGIAVNADNIALTLQPTGDALSTTTSSGSGLEILAGGLSLLQGCSDSQVLKWNETTDTWGCAADAGGTGVGDDVSVNGSNASGANFLDTAATGTSAGTSWNLNTTPTPNEITLTISNASATDAGVVTTGAQSFSGVKTFGGQIVANGGISLGTQTLQGTTAIIDFTNFDVAANGNTSVGGTLTVSQAATFNGDVTVAAGKSLTLTGGVTGTRPASPTEGMLYFDTTTKQLLTYANGKWQADRESNTKIVAASNSTQAAKDAADYVANGDTGAAGDGDQIEINAALSAAGTGKVYLMEGTYTIDATINFSGAAANRTLAGSGRGSIVQLADLDADIDMFTIASNRSVIRNLYLDGRSDLNTAGTQRGVNSTAAELLIEGNYFTRFRSFAFYTGLSSYNQNNIHGNNFVANATAIQASGTGDVIDDNIFTSHTSEAVQLFGSGSTFSGNTLTSNAVGVNVSGANLVTGNTIRSTTTFGISSQNSGSTISNNIVSGSGSSGIIIQGTNAVVSGNRLIDNGGSANNNGIDMTSVSADNNMVTGNVITDSSATSTNYAIAMTSGATGNYISGNTLGTGTINAPDASTVFGGQVNSSGNYMLQPSGTIELMKNTNITGTLNITSDVDTNGSLTVGTANQFVVSNAGVVTSGTWQGGSIQDAYLADNITINSAGTVDWAALNNYPAACPAGQAITQLGDTVTCMAFATSSGSGNYIQNQFATDQTADFRISGVARANTAVVTPAIRPVADSTTALNIQNAAGSTNILTVDTTNGRIGIGATPGYKLHVADTTTANSGTNNIAAFFNYNVDPSSLPAATTTYYGQQTFVTSSSVNLNANVTMYGDVATVQNAGNATLGAAVGAGAVAQNSGTGVITNAIGGRFKASNTGSGSITNGVALQASTPEVTAGSIGTAYGLFIETQDVSGVGTGYGIWQAGAGDLNVFAGKVGIGMVPSANALEVNGTGLFGTSVLTQTVDTYSAAALNVGTANATQINLNKNVVVAANQSLTITGGATGTRPASPTEGMMYFDTTTKQLLVYANGKWQADRSTSTKIVASGGFSGCSGSVPVASSNPDGADYVTNSCTSAQTAINNAISALPAGGGTVYLMEGTYIIDGPINLVSNLKLVGAGNGTIIKLKNGINADINVTDNPSGTKTSVSISSIKFDGNKANNTAGNQNGVYANSVGATTAPGLTVRDVYVENFRSNGIYIIGGAKAIVAHNFSTLNGGNGIHVNGNSNATISDNEVRGNTATGGIMSSGISTTLSNNKVIGNTGYGITVTGDRSTITGNVVESNTTHGISMGGNNGSVTGNTVYANNSNGIYLTTSTVSTTVSGNTVTNSGANGIEVYNSSFNNIISGNTVSNSGTVTASSSGIVLNANCDNTRVTDNRITDTAGTGYAILITGPTNDTVNAYVAGNTFSGTGATSISDLGTNTIYGGQVNDTGNFLLQPTGTIELMKNTNITGTLNITSNVDTNGSLTVGTADQFVVSNLGVVTAGTWQGAAVADAYVSDTLTVNSASTVDWQALNNYPAACAAGSAITQLGDTVTCGAFAAVSGSSSYIQNQNAAQQASASFWISGTGRVDTALQAPTFDTATASTLTLGGNATSISVADDVTVAAGKSLTVTGGNTASRPSSPTEGMIYFDITTKQLLTYANGKWQTDRSDAVFVAASNSSQADKDAADYVTDGNTGAAADGDQVQINAALTAASGKKVVLLAGTYVADASISIPNNTILTGVGLGTKIEVADLDANIDLITQSNATGEGVTVRDLMLNGRSDLNTTGNINGIYFSNMGGGSGSSIRRGAIIQDIELRNFRNAGISLVGANSKVSNTNSVATLNVGMSVSGDNNTISDNKLDGSNNGMVTSGTNNILRGNKINGGNSGIVATGTGTVIGGNTVSNAIGSAINLYDAVSVAVTNNTVTGTAHDYGIFSADDTTISNSTITGNAIEGSEITGIHLWYATNVTISANNVKTSAAAGIRLESSSNNNVTSNTLTDNGGSTTNNAIYLVDADSNSVSDNKITDSSATTNNYAINISDAISDTNYITGNTLGTGSINNLGTGTIFGGQVNNAGNYLLQPSGSIELLKNTNVTGNLTATGTLQGTRLISTVATGTAPLTVNSTTLVANLNTDLLDGQDGSYYQNANNINAGTLAVSRGGTGAGSFTQYGILFGNGTGAFGVTAAGTTGQCLIATTSAAPTWGACATTTLQGTYDSSSPATINLSDNKNFTINAADTATDSSIVFNLQCATCSANGGRFAVQDAGIDIFTINPNGDIIIGTSTNNITLASGAGYEPILNGTARHNKKIVLTPEYVGTVLDAADDTPCVSANSGSMISGYEPAGRMNYYRWTSTMGTAQCYDVVVQVPIPSDWAGWTGTPINVQMKKNATGTGAYAIRVLDSAGTGDSTFCAGGGYCSPGTLTTSWGNMTSGTTFAGSGYTAGDYFTVKIRMSSTSSANVYLGNITLNYMSKY